MNREDSLSNELLAFFISDGEVFKPDAAPSLEKDMEEIYMILDYENMDYK